MIRKSTIRSYDQKRSGEFFFYQKMLTQNIAWYFQENIMWVPMMLATAIFWLMDNMPKGLQTFENNRRKAPASEVTHPAPLNYRVDHIQSAYFAVCDILVKDTDGVCSGFISEDMSKRFHRLIFCQCIFFKMINNTRGRRQVVTEDLFMVFYFKRKISKGKVYFL